MRLLTELKKVCTGMRESGGLIKTALDFATAIEDRLNSEFDVNGSQRVEDYHPMIVDIVRKVIEETRAQDVWTGDQMAQMQAKIESLEKQLAEKGE